MLKKLNKADKASLSDQYQRQVSNLEGGEEGESQFSLQKPLAISQNQSQTQSSLLGGSLFKKMGRQFENLLKGSIEEWTEYFQQKHSTLIPQYEAPVVNNELVYSVCGDLVLNLSPEEFYQKANEPVFKRKDRNFGAIYFDNRKQFLCTDLETMKTKVIYEAEEDIRSFQIRDDGLIFLVYWTDTIDLIKPTEEGVYERIQEFNTNTVRNYQIYLSEGDQGVLYMRAVMEEREVDEGNISGNEGKEEGHMTTIYKEGIKKMKFEAKDYMKTEFELIDLDEFTVESHEKKQLQQYLMDEERQIGFVYDTHQQCITILNLSNMNKHSKVQKIDSGEITNMFIDFNKLYYQQGKFHDVFQVEFQTFNIDDLQLKAPRVFEDYKIKQHISTVKLGKMLVIGMLDKVAFLDEKKGVLLGEFNCVGRVDSIRMSNDEKEMYIYTDKCKFYRIQRNQTKHFMHWVPNTKEVRCFVPIYNDNDSTKLEQILFCNHKVVKFIDAEDIHKQRDNMSLDGKIVYNMELQDDKRHLFAIIGEKDTEDYHAFLYLIDLEEQALRKRYDQPIRKDSKLLLHNNKAIILEPWRTKKIYVVDENQMVEVPEEMTGHSHDNYVQLDGMEKSEKHNVLMVMCELRIQTKLLKFIRLLDLEKLTEEVPVQERVRDDVLMNGQTQAKTIRICPNEKLMAISHGDGKIELWQMKTLITRENAKPYRIYKNHGDSDFVFYYSGSFARLVSLKSKKGDTYKINKQMFTYLIIQEIEKQDPNLRQVIDINAKEINMDYDQNIMFLRDHHQQLYQLDMNNFQKQSSEEMNYFRTELMRQYIHNYPKMSEIRRKTILNEIPFNTHFNWHFNLVSVMACMGQKGDAISGLFHYGVPYIAELNGNTPMFHAVEMHDQDVVNVIMSHLNDDANQLPIYDIKYMIANYTNLWKKNFTFQPTQFTMGAYQKVKGVFQGKVKKDFAFTESKYVGITVLNDCIDFEDEDDQTTLKAETFKIQLNFKFQTRLCFDLLDLILESNTEFLENTQIDSIIDHIFEKNKIRFFIQNLLYIGQAVCVSIWEFYPQLHWVHISMMTLAGIILFIELIQIQHDPCDYLTSYWNFLEIFGNVLVILCLKVQFFNQFTWVMILLIMLKAVLTLRISKSQRTLIQMIIECINGMGPFLTIMTFSVFSFALVNYSIEKDEGSKKGLLTNLGMQYRILFGENTVLEYERKFLVKWFLYWTFTILMCTVMLNLLISIISDDYERVQATQKSTDLKAKCDILYDYGQLETFFKRNIMCMKITAGEPMYVHRFIPAYQAGEDSTEGQWVGRIKILTQKQQQLLDSIEDVKSSLVTQESNFEKRFDQMEKMIHRGMQEQKAKKMQNALKLRLQHN